MAPKEPMTLYYRRTVPGTTEPCYTALETTTTSNGSASALTNISNIPMCTKNYKNFNDDIINFVGSRTSGNKYIPAMFLETVTIVSKPYQSEDSANMITATANYVDSGSSSVTTIPYVNYTVTAASGKFEGYKNIKIIYDNGKEKKRTVILS